jgi:hypothetical protein
MPYQLLKLYIFLFLLLLFINDVSRGASTDTYLRILFNDYAWTLCRSALFEQYCVGWRVNRHFKKHNLIGQNFKLCVLMISSSSHTLPLEICIFLTIYHTLKPTLTISNFFYFYVPYAGLMNNKIIKIIEMGRVCGTYGRQERCIQGFGGETWGKETTWKTQA